MRNLRAIRNSEESEAHPHDLQSIGPTPLLNDLPPIPYLVVDGASLSLLEPLEKRFQLQLYPQDQLLVLESNADESYKHKFLRLWYAARHLFEKQPSLRMQIRERNLLRESLLANIGHRHFIHPNRQQHDAVAVQLDAEGTLSVSVLLQLLLVQLGYPLQAGENDLVLPADHELFHYGVSAGARKALAV
jgi:hypothetical protein